MQEIAVEVTGEIINFREYLEIAQKAARKAGEILLYEFKNGTTINKNCGRDIKLQADKNAEKVILDILSSETNIPILSEEAGSLKTDSNNSCLWIVDPLDGSLNFLRNISINCISIALWENSKPILGVIYDFLHDNMYIGEVSSGASLNGKKILVSEIIDISQSILCTGFPVYSDFDTASLNKFVKKIQEFKKIRLLGSAAFSLSLVAQGSVECYKEDNIAIWDVAAGIALVLAAGGKVSYEEGKEQNLLNVVAHNGYLDLN